MAVASKNDARGAIASALLQSVCTPDVFLCHSSKDKKFVRRLADDFERLAIKPWFDAWEVGPGDSLLERLGEGIAGSKFFCVVLSKQSAESLWCQTELREAMHRSIASGKNNILPIKYGDVETPSFLNDTVRIDMKRYSIEGIARISGVIYGLPLKAVDRFLHYQRPKTIGDLAEFILDHTKDRRIRFGDAQWSKLIEILKSQSIEISDDIDIFDRRTGKIFPVA